ncbi:MAG: response regulator transcription factor [Flavobacteriaceae bacterium]
MKVLIVEDKFYTRKGLITIIDNLQKDIEITGECETVKEAVKMAKEQLPDLVLLDINLPDGNAFDFLEETTELDYRIIFITAYDNFAIRAIKKDAIDYILKPVVPEELEKAIDKVFMYNKVNPNQFFKEQKKTSKKKDKLLLGFNDSMQVIPFQELMFCQSNKGCTTFVLANGKSFLSTKPLKEFEHQFPTSNFIRTHQSFIVNLDYVDKYLKEGYCILNNNQKVPVSVRRKKQFMSKFVQ